MKQILNSIKTDFENLKKMIMGLSFYKKNPDGYDIILRNNGKKISINFISRQGKALQLLLDLCINLSEYIKFYLKIKTEIDFYHLLGNSSNDYKSNIFNAYFNTKLSGENLKYLLNSIITVLKNLKFKNKEGKTKLINLINLIIYFIGINFKVEYDIDFIKYQANKEYIPGQYISLIRSLLEIVLRPYIEYFGLTNLFKAINLDCLSFSFGICKYENGLSIEFKLPGISRYFEELFK